MAKRFFAEFSPGRRLDGAETVAQFRLLSAAGAELLLLPPALSAAEKNICEESGRQDFGIETEI